MAGVLSRLLLVAENYPELKANQNFLTLQSQIEGTENRIAVERRRYNQAVATFNAYRPNDFNVNDNGQATVWTHPSGADILINFEEMPQRFHSNK